MMGEKAAYRLVLMDEETIEIWYARSHGMALSPTNVSPQPTLPLQSQFVTST